MGTTRANYNIGKQNNNDKAYFNRKPNGIIKTSGDYLLFDDDTSIEHKNNNDITIKLQTYEETATKENLLINWEKCIY